MLKERGAPRERHTRSLFAGPTHLADVLLHQLRARNADKGAISVVSNGACKKRLPRSGRAVQKHALRLSHAERLEKLGVLNGQLDDLEEDKRPRRERTRDEPHHFSEWAWRVDAPL